MAQFRHDNTTPSPAASRLLHPTAEAEPLAPPADVLPDIAAGLARTVPADGDTHGGTALLATAAYEASLETIEADSCRVIDSRPGLPASLALVHGQLLAWTADDGFDVLSAGGLCSIAGGERVQLVNIGPERAVAVLVRARRVGDTDSTDSTGGIGGAASVDGGMARFDPCVPVTG